MPALIDVRIPNDLYERILKIIERKKGVVTKSYIREFILNCLSNVSDLSNDGSFEIISWKKSVRKALSIPESLKQELEKYARELGITLSSLVVSLLRKCVEKCLAEEDEDEDIDRFYELVNNNPWLSVWNKVGKYLEKDGIKFISEKELENYILDVLGDARMSTVRTYINRFYHYRVIDLVNVASDDIDSILETRVSRIEKPGNVLSMVRKSSTKYYEVILYQVLDPYSIDAYISIIQDLLNNKEKIIEYLKNKIYRNNNESDETSRLVNRIINFGSSYQMIIRSGTLYPDVLFDRYIVHLFKNICAILRIAKLLRYNIHNHLSKVRELLNDDRLGVYNKLFQSLLVQYGLLNLAY